MKYKKQILLFLSIVFFSITISNAQCNIDRTVVVCAMETIDSDTNGTPDGIVNLYDLTFTVLADGVWSTTPDNAIALDPSTGNLSTWDLPYSSDPDPNANIDTTYTFTLSHNDCGNDPVMVADFILGPFSGVASPPDPDGVNFYICSTDVLDLSTVLVSNQNIPVAHLNGVWAFTDSSPSIGTLDEDENGASTFRGTVDYVPGLPRVDQNIYELIYTVPGNTLCTSESSTVVKVAVVRQVFPGDPVATSICESSIIAGEYDVDLNLGEDYLFDEDIEGYWVDENGDGSSPMINIKDIYNDLTNNGANPRFGCLTYGYNYVVEKRSVVCEDEVAIVRFTIYEQLRPFQQATFPVLCPGRSEDPLTIINLYDLIEFVPGFEYKSSEFTHWEFISGPSDLGLVSKRFEAGSTQTDIRALRCLDDPAIDDPDLSEPYYDPDGPVSINGASPGEYRFRFYVCSAIVGCLLGPCQSLETEVVLQILALDYAGQDTEVILCQDQTSVDLRSLLDTNGVDDIVETGIWRDDNGDVVSNTFDFPDVTYPATFTFNYTTTSSDGCLEDSDLILNVEAAPNAGIDGEAVLCTNNRTITLIEELGGNPDLTGTWIGPFGYQSPDAQGVFIEGNDTLPVLGGQEGIDVDIVYTYTYTVLGNDGCADNAQSIVEITFKEPVSIGNDRSDTFCNIDGSVNLFTILDNDTPLNGLFEDTSPPTGVLSADGVFDFGQLPLTGNPDDIYEFSYVIPGVAPCNVQSLTVSVKIINVAKPVVPNVQFCILDAIKLSNVVVEDGNGNSLLGTQYNWYNNLLSNSPITDDFVLQDGQEFYVTRKETVSNCESERVQVVFDILNIGEKFTNRDPCTLDFQDGVSPDGNNQNDTFQLFRDDIIPSFNIPEAFPDFDIKIYNRYGTLVFQGNINTGEFRGESNVSIRLGDDLPSGTYFYIFTPNFQNNLPIQGSFYLSR